MITNQIIQTSIDELRSITRVDLCVVDLEATVLASTYDSDEIQKEEVSYFVESPADSQAIHGHHFFKIYDDKQLEFVLIAKGDSDDTYMIGKIAVSSCRIW